MKRTLLILLMFFSAGTAHAEHKLRISLAGGYSLVNDLAGGGTFSIEPKLAIAYPITARDKTINVEIALLGLYETQLTGSDLRVPGFGFGLRIFYNDLGFIRPYFNHEIMTRIALMNGKSGAADSFSILLGLGADFPLESDRKKESQSFFADMSYVFYNVGYFGTAEQRVKSLFLTLGYEVPF